MHFLLTTLKVVYVLTTPMPELVDHVTVEAIRIRAKWENDDYICRGHIMNGMSDSLFDVYTNVESAKELWDSLESKILGQYTQHGLKIDESVSVSSIIDKLPPSWKDFKHTLKHGKDDLSLVQLGSHLRIEESLKAQDSDKGKGKEVGGPTVNMTEEGKNKNNKQNKGKKRSNEYISGSSSNKKPKLECLKCGKTGHFKRDYRSGNKKNANAGGSGKGSKYHSQDQCQNLMHVWNNFVKYSVSLISKAYYVQVDAIAWWIDSGATTHVRKDRCWFKTYEPVEHKFVLYMGDAHFAPVYGKGSVRLEFSSRKTVTLFNVLYGYIKNHKKTIKNGQTRTRETEEHKRSQRFKAKVKESQLQSTMGQQSQLTRRQIPNVPFESLKFPRVTQMGKTKGNSKLKGGLDYSSDHKHDGRVRFVKSSTLIGSLMLRGYAAGRKAQGDVDFILQSLTQVTQAVTSKDCQLGNPCD
ncbi:zinc finger, CCHC-type containing protein [Tanacetum coccineum]